MSHWWQRWRVMRNKSLKFVTGLAAVHRTLLSGSRLALRYPDALSG